MNLCFSFEGHCYYFKLNFNYILEFGNKNLKLTFIGFNLKNMLYEIA